MMKQFTAIAALALVGVQANGTAAGNIFDENGSIFANDSNDEGRRLNGADSGNFMDMDGGIFNGDQSNDGHRLLADKINRIFNEEPDEEDDGDRRRLATDGDNNPKIFMVESANISKRDKQRYL